MDELSSVLHEVLRALEAEAGKRDGVSDGAADAGHVPGGGHRARPPEGAAPG